MDVSNLDLSQQFYLRNLFNEIDGIKDLTLAKAMLKEAIALNYKYRFAAKELFKEDLGSRIGEG